MASMKDQIKESFKRHLTLSLAKRPDKASDLDRYQALALSIRDLMVDHWLATRDTYDKDNPKTINYISLEFLIGRTLGNAMINLEVMDAAKEAMAELGFDIEELREQEVDAGLGNGGLGRLAACFLDSMATLELPAYGYGIRYDFGIFKQQIEDDCQVEEPDNWLSTGNPWEIRRPELAKVIHFGGHVEAFQDAGINKITLIAFSENTGGNAFWKKIGWTSRSEDVNYYEFILNENNITKFVQGE